ncbi:hypothetical protein MPER_03368, partial [Moniliophthora perniciosa FA553]
YDARTALMPAVVNQQLLPKSLYHPLMSLDEDGYNLPSDWYMRICGLAAEVLIGETELTHVFPYTELQNYWSSRPRIHIGIYQSEPSPFFPVFKNSRCGFGTL